MASLCDCESVDAVSDSSDNVSINNANKRQRLSFGDSPEWDTDTFDPDKCYSELVRFFIIMGYPFTRVESSALSRLLRYYQPHFSLPSKMALERQCITLYKKEREILKKSVESLQGCVSITISGWTDIFGFKYMYLMAHYIDNDWKLRKRVINFTLTPFSETLKPEFSETLQSCLAEWKIKKLFSMTLDYPLTKNVSLSQLKNQLHEMDKYGSELLHMPCSAYIFKLLVREGLNLIDSSYRRIREAVITVMYSRRSEFEPKFYKIAKELKLELKKKLYLDFPEMWHSTYHMLENSLQFRDVFVQLESIDSNFTGGPTEDDWNKVGEVSKFLKLYYKAAMLFTDMNTTADMCFFETWKICMHLSRESKSSDPFVSFVASRMQAKFEEYWNSCFRNLAIATVLNPQHKMLLVVFCFQKLYGDSGAADAYIKCVRDCIWKLYNEYDSSSSDEMEVNRASSSKGGRNQFNMQEYGKFVEQYYITRPPKGELEVYLEEKVHPQQDKNFSLLNFWKLNENRFPKLARLARDVLAIPIVSLASQSIFHLGDRVLCECHSNMGLSSLEENESNMGLSSLEAMVCMQNWLQELDPSRATILECGSEWEEDEQEDIDEG